MGIAAFILFVCPWMALAGLTWFYAGGLDASRRLLHGDAALETGRPAPTVQTGATHPTP